MSEICVDGTALRRRQVWIAAKFSGAVQGFSSVREYLAIRIFVNRPCPIVVRGHMNSVPGRASDFHPPVMQG